MFTKLFKIEFTNKPPFDKAAKNIEFGLVVALTKTAKQGQAEVLSSLRSTFTLRGSWYEPRNKFGIKISAATKRKKEAEIKTLADWLVLHETGGVKFPRGRNLAIPTDNVRRNKKSIIPRGQRPAALRNKRTFVLQTKKGKVLFQRKFKGKRSRIVPLYNLEPRARIKKEAPFFPAVWRAVRANLNRNVRQEIGNALRGMK